MEATAATLARKLRHPLGRIRARALANLLFKLRARLVDVAAAPPAAVEELMAALVGSLADKELEPSALQVLQLLTDDERDAAACAPALRAHGAAAAFQRGGMDPNRHAAYEELLHRLLETSTAEHEERATLIAPTAVSEVTQVEQSRSRQATVSTMPARRVKDKDTAIDPLISKGWRFPHVALTTADEQFLFEFEVKWRLRASVPEIVEVCDTFRRDLLRDFPAEVFLQRPAILLRVLELAQQPLVPAASTPELTFGVNYFDEPLSRASFSWKPSVHATALHVSALKALESWLSALRHSMNVSMNPIFHTSPTSLPSTNFSATPTFDHRRLYYPQTTQANAAIGDDDGLSLGGSAYLLIATLLRLLSSPSYPHLHLLNLVYAATSFLNERSIPENGATVNSMDKKRVESLFAIVVDVIRVESCDDTLVEMRLLDWLFLVIRTFNASGFCVGDESDTKTIGIPTALWKWMLRQLARRCDPQNFSKNVELLNHIEPSASVALSQLSEAGDDTSKLAAVLQGESAEPSLALASKILLVVSNLTEQHRSIVADYVLQSLLNELGQTTEEPSKLLNEVLLGIVRLVVQEESSAHSAFGRRVLDGLIDWMVGGDSASASSQRVRVVIATITESGEFMKVLLCALAESRSDQSRDETLWRFSELVLHGFGDSLGDGGSSLCFRAFYDSMPLLQHLAYFDSSLVPTTNIHQRLQRTLVGIVHHIESMLDYPDKLLVVARCLLHRSVLIRKEASYGLLDRLSQLDSALVKQIPRNGISTVDPFGCFMEEPGENRRRALENEMLAILHPQQRSQEDLPTSEGLRGGGSILHRISRLRKLLSSLSISADAQSMSLNAAESTLQQILIDLVYSSDIDFTLLEDAGEVQELVHLCVRLLSSHEESHVLWRRDLRVHVLGLIRIVLLRSMQWRQRIRQDTNVLCTLLPFVFDEAAQVRAEMYFVVVSLTCSMDMILHAAPSSGLVVPSEFADTFGLFSARWTSCGITAHPITQTLQTFCSSALSTTTALLEALHDSTSTKLSPESSVQALWERLASAESFRSFLDAIYHTIHACHAVSVACAWISSNWKQAKFLRYLQSPPTSAKDQVVVAAILSFVNVVFDDLSTENQMDLVLLLRQNTIPIQISIGRHTQRSSSLSRETARILLRVGNSAVANMFAPLVGDTGLVKKLGDIINSYSLTADAASLDRSLWVELSLALVKETGACAEGSATVRDTLCVAIFSPLEAIAGRHRVPGSFQDRASFAVSVSCLMRLLNSGASAHWRTRLMFDTSATLRSTGFRIAACSVDANDLEVNCRILRLAADTFREESESDGVRSAALDLIFHFLMHFPKDLLPGLLPFIDGERFLPQLIRDLESRMKTRSQCNVLLNLSTVRLLRLLAQQQEKFNFLSLRNVMEMLKSHTEDGYHVLVSVIELLSLRDVFTSYEDHNVKCLRTQVIDDKIWHMSLAPIVLRTIAETAKFLNSLLRQSSTQVPSIVRGTPLMPQLIETIIDISKSFHFVENEATGTRVSLDAIDQSIQLLTLLLASHAALSLPGERLCHFVSAIAALLDPSQPNHFRNSCSRIVPVMVCGSSKELHDEVAKPEHASSLVSSLWTSYRELSEAQRMDPSISSGQGPAKISHLRRVAAALQALLSRIPHATTVLCGERHRAVSCIVQSIKQSFVAIRLAGGFGAKITGRDEAFCLELCQVIHVHCQVLSSLMVLSTTARITAREELLPTVIANNWSVMSAARRRGSSVLVAALRMMQNFIHANDANKTLLAVTMSSTRQNATSESERNLLAMVGDLAIGETNLPFEESWVSIAATILKSAFLQVECLHTAIRTGLVAKLFSSAQERSKRRRLTSKGLTASEERSLVELIGVLASVTTIDEGRQVALQVRELKSFLSDIFHFPEGSDLFVAGALFVRNMAFSKVSKSHISVWEPVLNDILVCLRRWGIENRHSNPRVLVASNHLSTALLCIIHDNKRAQSVLQSSQKSLMHFHDTLREWNKINQFADENQARNVLAVRANLDRTQSLVEIDYGIGRQP